MHACIYECRYVCIYVCLHICICAYICMYVHMCACVDVYVKNKICIYIYICSCGCMAYMVEMRVFSHSDPAVSSRSRVSAQLRLGWSAAARICSKEITSSPSSLVELNRWNDQAGWLVVALRCSAIWSLWNWWTEEGHFNCWRKILWASCWLWLSLLLWPRP